MEGWENTAFSLSEYTKRTCMKIEFVNKIKEIVRSCKIYTYLPNELSDKIFYDS